MKVPEERGNTATFEELAMPLFDQLYNFARWLTQDTAEAEDLVQETYAKALRGFSSFRLGTNFRAWMYRILRNSFLSSRTGLKTMVVLDGESDGSLLPAESTTPESLLLTQEDREGVQQALADLPVPFREILLLCEVEEMSYQEIAETLGIAMGTVMSRLYRARKAMRDLLLKRNEGGRHGM
jgi:RNA polymerase sigma-70 factor (ECF subfamily)